MSIPKIAEIKNQWLYQQVEVEFPTKESIAGMALYKDDLSHREFVALSSDQPLSNEFNQDDIFQVDFHRLTVMFALLQASRWSQEREQELIVEFLTQIIYSPPCNLYIGFRQGEPVAAAIVTYADESLLISDLIVSAHSETSEQGFVAALTAKLSDIVEQANQVLLEVRR
ncbi:hypothetical protein [Vibrio pacinii]|uniref:hypothetical protein n=1 Tax=Vibrio pacinii TaxID=170674 RepID=UPI000571941E|nr:hypothetical protein [Vibrio pacinii]